MTDRDNEKRGGSGNFANDPKRAAEAGKKGGEHSAQHQQSQSPDKRQQGSQDTSDKPGSRGGQR